MIVRKLWKTQVRKILITIFKLLLPAATTLIGSVVVVLFLFMLCAAEVTFRVSNADGSYCKTSLSNWLPQNSH